MEPQSIDLLIMDASEIILGEGSGPKVGTAFSAPLPTASGDIAIHEGKILEIGENLGQKYLAKKYIEANGMTILPGLIDSHTHLVHQGSRHHELEPKICGDSSYADMHQAKKGILYTVEMTRGSSDELLLKNALRNLDTMLLHGTTTIEAKTGYELTVKGELRQLQLLARLQKMHPMTIVPTLLGAHAVPEEFGKQNREGYVERIIKEMIPAASGLAKYCDVFCDPLEFNSDQTRRILEAASRYGMIPRIHVDQTDLANGGEIAVLMGAKSVSHADYTTKSALEKMAELGITVELLPAVTVHLGESTPKVTQDKTGRYEIAKDFWAAKTAWMVEHNVPLTIATNFNPGSSTTPSMQFAMQMGSRMNRMSFAQVHRAGSPNPAYSLGMENEIGSLAPGKNADIVIMNVPHFGQVIDRMGTNHVAYVIKNGEIVIDRVNNSSLVYARTK